MRSLSFAGWGALTGREYQGARSTLYALVDQLNHTSGAGLATVAQLSDRSGLSERWTRQRLQLLEDIGVIEWRRGAIINGTPQPSYFKILKTRLVELIFEARAKIGEVWAQRRLATAERLAQFKGKTVLTHRQGAYARGSKARLEHFSSSARAELSAGPHPLTGGSPIKETSPLEKNTLFNTESERTAPPAAVRQLLNSWLSPEQRIIAEAQKNREKKAAKPQTQRNESSDLTAAIERLRSKYLKENGNE